VKHATGVSRKPEKRIRLRPLLWLVIWLLAALIAWARGWQVAAFALLAGVAVVLVAWRVLWRHIQDARRPDPESTLHLKD
jgi:uncharacterized protein (DUF58 family)